MKKKHKITLLVIGILLALSLMLSSSYALWVFNVSQESTNVVQADCFEITFTDNNPIGLGASFPMKDGKGVYTTPYEFTLTNICEHAADISINLETLNDSQIDGENLRVDVNGHIHTYGDENYVEPILANASSAAKFYDDTIAAGDSKSYNLRLWIKEDADSDDVINKTLSSKITIRSTLRKNYKEATLKSGSHVNVALKTLAGDNLPTINTYNTSITSIQRSITAPQDGDNADVISDNSSTNLIYAWFDNGTIYIYSDVDKIYMNRDSSYLFENLKSVTSIDLSYYDTSKVNDMSAMFWNNNLTNLDVSKFDTSNVTDMYSMFNGMSNLISLDVSNFNTSKVTDMSSMFNGMSNLTNLDVSNFDTSKVTKMGWMFYGMSNLTNLDVSNFDTSKVTDMSSMFNGMSNLTSLDVSHFDTSKVTDMSAMFYGMSSLTNLYVSNFDTSNVTDMSGMFDELSNLTNLDVSGFDTSNVTNMSDMFEGMSSLTMLDLSNFKTNNVTSMYRMFYGMSNLTNLEVGGFDTSKVTNMNSMFESMSSLIKLDLSSFDTSNVTDMSSMFNKMSNLTSLDLSNFDTSKLTNMRGMFYFDKTLITIYVGGDWDLSNVTDGSFAFAGAYNIVGGAGTTYDANHTDAEYARVDDPANGKPGYFTLKTS